MRSSAPTAIFMSAATWGTVARLKDGDLRYQIMPDPTGESRRQLFGIKVFVTPHVGAAVVVADMCAIAVGVRDKMNVFYDPFRYSEFRPVGRSRHEPVGRGRVEPRGDRDPDLA
jgi:HK97 family phage major capsid protein